MNHPRSTREGAARTAQKPSGDTASRRLVWHTVGKIGALCEVCSELDRNLIAAATKLRDRRGIIDEDTIRAYRDRKNAAFDLMHAGACDGDVRDVRYSS